MDTKPEMTEEEAELRISFIEGMYSLVIDRGGSGDRIQDEIEKLVWSEVSSRVVSDDPRTPEEYALLVSGISRKAVAAASWVLGEESRRMTKWLEAQR